MKVLEALKFAGDNVLKHYVWGNVVIEIIRTTVMDAEVSVDLTGFEVIDVIDGFEREARVEIFSTVIPNTNKLSLKIKVLRYFSHTPRNKLFSHIVQSSLSVFSLAMLGLVFAVAYNTIQLLGGEIDTDNASDVLAWLKEIASILGKSF